MTCDTQPDELVEEYEPGWCPVCGLPEPVCSCGIEVCARSDTIPCPPPADCEVF